METMEMMETMELSRSEAERHPINLQELERWASLAAAGAVIVYGFSRRTAPGVALAVAATPLVYRGVSGRWPFEDGYADDTRHALSGSRGIHVRESVRIERPVSEIYAFWRQLENLPRVLTHLESVDESGDGRSHWIARGPADLGVEWDAEIINDIEDKLIAWRSLPHSDIVTAGSVNFKRVRGGRATELSVHLQYEPPAGRAGAFLRASLVASPRRPSVRISVG
jgi:uncharacterized membrane protein